MVGQGSAYDLHLTRHLKAATILRAPSSPAVVERFMVVQKAIGVQAGRGDRVEATLRRYVEQAKAGGMVADALTRHGIGGAVVAPAG